MKKLYLTAVIALFPVFLFGCSGKASLPQKHAIGYEKGLETTGDDDGSDSFESLLDSEQSKYYTVNDYYNMTSQDTLHIISHFETYQQTTEYTCGPAALLMVLHYYGIDDYNELELAQMAGTDEVKGTFVEGMCSSLDTIGLSYDANMSTEKKFDSAESVSEYFTSCIDDGRPVLVNWEDWNGHWQVVIGIDTCSPISVYDDVIIFADPYDVTDQYQDGYYIYPLGRFVSMWREGQCSGKTVPYEQPYVTVKKE